MTRTLHDIIKEIKGLGRLYVSLKGNYFCAVEITDSPLYNRETKTSENDWIAEVRIYYYLANVGQYSKHIDKSTMKKIIEYLDSHNMEIKNAGVTIKTDNLWDYDVTGRPYEGEKPTLYVADATRKQLDKIIDLPNVKVFSITSEQSGKYLTIWDYAIEVVKYSSEYLAMIVDMLNFALPEEMEDSEESEE
jgi:hypothetical protein